MVAFALLAAAAANASGITGTVTNDTGAPLGGMTVSAYRTDDGSIGGTATTSASGAYAITDMFGGGQFRVLAYDPSGTYATSFWSDAESFETSKTLLLESILTASNINFRLVRAGFAAGGVTGTGGNALPDMTVAAYNPSGTRRGFAVTDAAGNFTPRAPAGELWNIAAYDVALELRDDVLFWRNIVRNGGCRHDHRDGNRGDEFSTSDRGETHGRRDRSPHARADRQRARDRVRQRWQRYRARRYECRWPLRGRSPSRRTARRSRRSVGKYAATYVPDAESFSTEPVVAQRQARP